VIERPKLFERRKERSHIYGTSANFKHEHRLCRYTIFRRLEKQIHNCVGEGENRAALIPLSVCDEDRQTITTIHKTFENAKREAKSHHSI
jgi:hypothetical protein